MTVWCVEDDDSIRDIEVYSLKATGFTARGFADAFSFTEALATEKPSLVLLDIMLPGKDGATLLAEMKSRADTRDIPVIMATAKGMEYDKVQALDGGADDYLVKPFGMMEMISRVRAVLRRCASVSAGNTLRAGDVCVMPDEHTVTVNGERVELTFKEYELLKLFLEKPGIAFTRDMLFNEIWGMDFCGETRTVDMHILTLRQKLGDAGRMIQTVRNVGYRLEVPE